jgi:NAD+ diphosphatase
VTIVTSPSLPSLALARGTVDRAGDRRHDTEWLATRWSDPTTRVLMISDGAVAVEGEPPALVLLPAARVPEVESERRWLLGLDADGGAIFAVPGPLPDGAAHAGLREVGALLNDRDAGLMTTAVALDAWHGTHTHCARCGAPTRITEAGMVRVCPEDGSLHHPLGPPGVSPRSLASSSQGSRWSRRSPGRYARRPA